MHACLPDISHTEYLDCSHEVSPVADTTAHTKNWYGREIEESHWLFPADARTRNELNQLAELIQNQPVQLLQRQADEVDFTYCRQWFAHLRDTLDNGIGFAVADRLPVDDYPIEVIVELYWLLGQLIGPAVAQKHNGEMIYSVHDTQQKYSYGVRGSRTNVELNFHTDNAFGKCPPEYVGLFCKQPAKSGGISRFCSLYSLHTKLQQSSPAALQRLYQPMLFDRQQEHLPGKAKVTLAPFFNWQNKRLRARANPSLIRKGYQVAEIAPDKPLKDALELIDEISAEDVFWFEAPLQKGQIQYLNNREIGHYRSEFSDYDEAGKKRHLYRLWHRHSGSRAYDG